MMLKMFLKYFAYFVTLIIDSSFHHFCDQQSDAYNHRQRSGAAQL